MPLIVKDNIDVAGLPTTSGCRALAAAMPKGDATIITRLRAAGAIVLGKSNMAELSFEVRSRSGLAGDVRNPFNRTMTCGGSSGGTAAAVAAGFAVAGLGTDTGGSIRNPAGFTGLVGLRPTHGRLPMDGIAPLSPSTDTVGPIARSVADAALLFTIMKWTEPAPVADTVDGMRVGVLRQFVGRDAAVNIALERALAALSREGVAIVDPVTVADDLLPRGGRAHIVDAEFVIAFDRYLAANFPPGSVPASVADIFHNAAHHVELTEAIKSRLDPAVISATALASIAADRLALTDALRCQMADHRLDALVYPTALAPPTSLDKPASGWAPELAAMTGWPALSVNAGVARSGVPLGIDLLTGADGEPLLFALGSAIERQLGPRPLPY